MSKNKLFAIDPNTNEIIVSDSASGSNKIDLIEKITRQDDEILYNAVFTLTLITKMDNFDVAIFKAMDKVCQLLYAKKSLKS